MGTRILGGIAGWLLGVAPLLAINVIDYFGIYYFPDPFLVGAVALVAGLLLGGIAAGLIGGRSRRTGGGAIGAGTTGAVAAALYAISVIAFMQVARTFDALPLALTEHPIRASAGVVFLGALLLLIAYLTGALAGSSATERAPRPTQSARPASKPATSNTPDAQRIPGTSRPGNQAYGAPPYGQPRYGDAAPPSRPAGARPGGLSGPSGPSGPNWQSPDASDPRYAGARVYGPPSRPAGTPPDRGTDSTPRWR